MDSKEAVEAKKEAMKEAVEAVKETGANVKLRR